MNAELDLRIQFTLPQEQFIIELILPSRIELYYTTIISLDDIKSVIITIDRNVQKRAAGVNTSRKKGVGCSNEW